MTVGAAFNGTTSEIRSNTGTDFTHDVYTFVAMVYNTSATTQRSIVNFANGANSNPRVVFDSTTNIAIEHDAGEFPFWGGVASSASWHLLVITKATGNVAPKLYLTKDGSAWTPDGAAADAGTAPNPPATISDVWVGDSLGAAFWNGDIVAIALANTEVNSATAHSLTDFNNWSTLTNLRFFTGTSLTSAGTMNDTGSGNNDETSRTGISAGAQTIPAWFTNFGAAAAPPPTYRDRRPSSRPAHGTEKGQLLKPGEKPSGVRQLWAPATASADVNVTVTATTDVAFVANNPTTDFDINAGSAAVTFTANNPTASVKPSAGSAAVTFTANNPSLDVRPNAGVAPVAFTANQATASVKVNAGSAPVVFTANDATVSTATITNAPAGNAAVSFVANNATVDERPNAGAAAVTFTANNASLSVKPSAGAAAVSFTANQPTADVRPNAGNALVLFTANNATVTTGSNVSAPAGNAAVTFTANQAGTSVKVNAGVAAVAFVANNPTAVPAISPAAGVASVAFTAQQAGVAAAVSAITAIVVFTAGDATVPAATQPAPQLEPAALYYRPGPAIFYRPGIAKLYRPDTSPSARPAPDRNDRPGAP